MDGTFTIKDIETAMDMLAKSSKKLQQRWLTSDVYDKLVPYGVVDGVRRIDIQKGEQPCK